MTKEFKPAIILPEEIIISFYGETPHQIAFLENGVYTDVEPYSEKYHAKYLDIATKEQIEK